MTPERINVVIAKSLGWRKRRPGLSQWIAPHGGAWNSTPSYTTDLNACAKMEDHLLELEIHSNRDLWLDYEDDLRSVTRRCLGILIKATALQRCEAYLRTIGKWEESDA